MHPQLFTYFIVAVLLFGLELLYFRVAERFRIIDRPNERSSHAHPTIRGGGIIFLIAALLFSLFHGGSYPLLMGALLLSGLVSFVDDIRSLPTWMRFLSHLCSGLLVLNEAGLTGLPAVYLLVIIILIIGIINAYNFMDGINGITGLYGLAVVAPLFFTEQNAQIKDLQLYTIIGLLVFLFFNARKKARCFAGDVGSVTMAILIVFFLIVRIAETQNINYLGFLLLYGTDTVLTIVQRLYLRENILKAHRRHLFQIYCNEYKVPHLVMSSVYAVVQFGVNWYIIGAGNSYQVLSTLILIAGTVYILLKFMAYRGLRKKG